MYEDTYIVLLEGDPSMYRYIALLLLKQLYVYEDTYIVLLEGDPSMYRSPACEYGEKN
jgi:hypothetical protein